MRKKVLIGLMALGLVFGLGLSIFGNLSGDNIAHAATDNRTRRVEIGYDIKSVYTENGKKLNPPRHTKYNVKYANVSIHARYQKTTSKVISNFPLVSRYTVIYK
ncbi:hypothetical protein [Enterococcus sp. AZ126]|uniref:hypothetical protein n=1 Tax=Enterococcus sp. AZ126 TaxID=2774635 RepID=UPI003F2425F5